MSRNTISLKFFTKCMYIIKGKKRNSEYTIYNDIPQTQAYTPLSWPDT